MRSTQLRRLTRRPSGSDNGEGDQFGASGNGRFSWPIYALLAAVLALLVIALVVHAVDRRSANPRNPLAGHSLYVNPDTAASQQVAKWRSSGEKSEAAALTQITDHQQGLWLSDSSPSTLKAAHGLVIAAAAARKLPLLVIYDIPDRDCGGYSGGGEPSSEAYIRWIYSVTAAIGTRPAIVILEPDAVADMGEGCVPQSELTTRQYDLSEAIQILRSNRATRVYLDAGNPGWIKNIGALSELMRKSGALKANGFALNTANFQTLSSNLAYGASLSSRLGGEHFVIDTSRNGNGPYQGSTNQQAWCNPPGRKLGVDPSTNTGHADVDAYLWIKQPGDSDGTCRGGTPAGTWWPAYALGLTASAS